MPGLHRCACMPRGRWLPTGWSPGRSRRGDHAGVGQDRSSWICAAAERPGTWGGTSAGQRAGAAGRYGLGEFAGMVAGRLAQNVAVLASHGTIRYRFAGTADRPLEPAELAAARGDVERALADGAAGLSSGLEYVPSRFRDGREIAAGGAAGRDRLSVRLPSARLRTKVRARLASSSRSASGGVRVHASHLWATPADLQRGRGGGRPRRRPRFAYPTGGPARSWRCCCSRPTFRPAARLPPCRRWRIRPGAPPARRGRSPSRACAGWCSARSPTTGPAMPA